MAANGRQSRPFTDAEENLIRSVGRPRTWNGGVVLFLEGDAPDSVVLLDAGTVKITADAQNGYTSLLAIRGPGELVGEMACIDGGARSATVTAMREVRGTVIASERFLGLLEQNRTLALSVTRSVTLRLRHSDGLRTDQGAMPASVRVARVLLDLALRHGLKDRRHPGSRVVLVSQADLAGAAGTSRESVVRMVRLLQKDEVLTTYRGRIVVHDLGALGSRADL